MQHLSKEDAERLALPIKLTALQHNFLTWHERLNHLYFSEMFQLVKFGIFPKKFLAFKDYKPLRAYWLFGKSHRKWWRTKGYVRHGIKYDDDNTTGADTSTDQLVSAQSGLVPQTSGRLTGGRIWGANVMVDQFSNFISVHLINSI